MPSSPAGIAVNNKGVIAVADLDGHCIQVFDETEKFVRKLGSPGHMDGQFDEPVDVTFFNDDEILVADECNHRIQQLNVQTGNFVKSFGKQGSGDGEFKIPTSVCISSDGCFMTTAEFRFLQWMVNLCLSLKTAAQKGWIICSFSSVAWTNAL